MYVKREMVGTAGLPPREEALFRQRVHSFMRVLQLLVCCSPKSPVRNTVGIYMRAVADETRACVRSHSATAESCRHSRNCSVASGAEAQCSGFV